MSEQRGVAVVIADAVWRHDYDGTHKYDHLHRDGTTVAHEADEGCAEISLRAAVLATEAVHPTVCPRCGWRSEPWPEHPPADLLDFMRPVEVPE